MFQMELQQFTTFPFVLIFFLFLLMIVKQSQKSKFQKPTTQLPPGPSKLPLIGHLHHLLGGLPHHALRDLAKVHGPIMYLKLGEVSTVIVSSAGVAKQVMKTHDLMFVDRPQTLFGKIVTYGNKDVILAPYGEHWRQLRKICTVELLSANRVQSFGLVREEEVSNLIRRVSLMAGSKWNLSQNISMFTTDITARAAFGDTCKEKQAFIEVTKVATGLASGLTIPDLFPSVKVLEVITGFKSKLEILHSKIDHILNSIIRDRKKNRKANMNEAAKKNLLDVLLRLQESTELEFPVTEDIVKAVTFDMFAGGTETSSTTLEWTFSELLRNPRVMDKAQAEVRHMFKDKKKIDQAAINELKYTRLVIKEALRLHPPLPLLLPRVCRERCEIEGFEIPKGTQVIINAWAIGRDPENWIDPESFEPERFQDISIDYQGTNFAYIPFGAGRRMCPGRTFGMASVELPLAMLLYHFDWKLVDGVSAGELDMSEVFGATVGRKHDLYVIPTPYRP